MISRRHFLGLTAATVGAGVLGATHALAIEPRFSLIVKQWTVESASWPASAPALRIGILTDLHAVEPWMPAHRIWSIVQELNAQKPDIIVLLGDYVSGLRHRFVTREVPVAEWMAPLRALSAPLGVYAVLGNHDFSSGEAPEIRIAFGKAGIPLLENRACRVHMERGHFWITGLLDQFYSKRWGIEDLRDTLRHVTDGAPVILLAHEPDIFDIVPKRVALTLSGHTHGGQIDIPFIGRPAFMGSHARRYARYAYGHFKKPARHMIVSSGLGLSNIPIRFMVPPELAIVTLRHAEPSLNAPLIVKA